MQFWEGFGQIKENNTNSCCWVCLECTPALYENYVWDQLIYIFYLEGFSVLLRPPLGRIFHYLFGI